MFSGLYFLHSLRFAVPTAVMIGVAPQYLSMWMTWRVLSSIMPRRVYERGDECLYDMYQSLITFFFETYTGAEVIMYGDPIPWDKKENVLFLCNHQCTVDWIVADLLAIRQGSLGRIRYILKSGLKFLPLYGFYFGQHGCIYVKRNGPRDHHHMTRKLLQLKKGNTPMWLVIFPEGTRFDVDKPEVIEKSKAFAEEQGLQVLQNVLTPRTKATEASLEALGDYVDAIYDLTIAYKGAGESALPRTKAKGMIDFLESWGQQIHVYCHRYQPSEIPQDEAGRKQWVHKTFAEKDRILSRFYSEEGGGCLPGVPRRRRLSWIRTTPYFVFWMATLAPFLVTKWGRSAYWKMWLVTGVGSVSYMALLFDKLQS